MLLIILQIVVAMFSVALSAAPACSEKSGNSALVVIDMQNYFVERNGVDIAKNPKNTQKLNAVLEAQSAAIEKAKAAKIPIIFIEYVSTDTNENYGGTMSDLISAAAGYRNVVVIKKTTDSMLDSKNKNAEQLKRFLRANNIGKVLITGANGGSCVHDSIEDSLANNCDVIAYTSGIADFNYKTFVHPYSGRFEKFSKQYQSYEFSEVSKLESLEVHMINSEHKSKRPQSKGAR